MLLDERLIADAIPFSAVRDGLVLLQPVPGRCEIRFGFAHRRERLLGRGFRCPQPAESARVNDGHVHPGGKRFGLSRIQVCLRLVEFRFEVALIQFDEKRSGFYELIVLRLRIDVHHGAANARAERMKVSVYLRVVRGLESSGIEP